MQGTKDAKLMAQQKAGSDGTGPELEEAPKRGAGTLVKVHTALLLMQLGFAGHQILSRVALTSGLSQFVYAIYRNAIALLLMSPFAYVLEKKERPPITAKLLGKFFLLGLTGIVGSQQLFLAGLILTSATFAATMQNAVPVVTFLMAWMLGLEKVRLDRRHGLAKVLGTVVCVFGAVFMSLYQGPAAVHGWNEPESVPSDDDRVNAILGHRFGAHALQFGLGDFQIGGILLLINTISWAAYLIMQAPILKVCPTPLTITAYTYLFGSLQVLVIMFAMTGGNVSWSLSWGPQVFSVAYAGVISSGINFSLQSWAIQKGGPLLVSLYTPVQTIIVAILSVLILGDSLYVGSIIGGLGEIAGLYLVTWGQLEHKKQDAIEAAAGMGDHSDEESVIDDPRVFAASALTQPLLASAEAELAHEREQQQQSRPQVAAPSRSPRLALSRSRRQSSFYHDEPSASFSPHHYH